MEPHGGTSPNAQLFGINELSDITIIVGDREIMAHRVILAAHSKHFREKFASELYTGAWRLDEVKMDKEFQVDVNSAASYGLIAWCYGLLYAGDGSFSNEAVSKEKAYFGCNKETHLQHIIDLHVTAKKHVSPLLEAHTKENFASVLKELVDRFKEDPTEDSDQALALLKVLKSVTWQLYNYHGEHAKELRTVLARAVGGGKKELGHLQQFKELMMEYPELCFDMLMLPEERPPSPVAKSSPQKKRRMRVESGSDLDSD